MFEIGSSLREARRRRGLGLADVEAATKIRARYLEALEHERFELLPSGVYRRSFLRGYAEFLDLDGDAYVAEYEARFETSQPEPVLPPPHRPPAVGLAGALRPEWVAVAAAVALLIGVVAWKLGGSSSNVASQTPLLPPAQSNRTPHGATPPVRQRRTATPTPRARPAVLVLTAARGTCWLAVRTGTAAGPLVYEGTLLEGRAVRFGLRKRLWIRIGAPWNLDAAIGGRPATRQLPSRLGDVVATAAGLKPAGT
jgi:hypothetical protein